MNAPNTDRFNALFWNDIYQFIRQYNDDDNDEYLRLFCINQNNLFLKKL